MIFGIGTDIVKVSRFNEMQSLESFAKKCLSIEELLIFKKLDGLKQPRYLAKQFCMKEAISKALGTGIRNEVTLPNMTIVRDDLGKPIFTANNDLEIKMNNLGISKTHVSLADEKNYVVAFAILET
ncbi:MAG: holo-ACP synthase [SAR86 cluster bacterium]|nr:holo-ACP synthase [SAR86 cluster bacterium]